MHGERCCLCEISVYLRVSVVNRKSCRRRIPRNDFAVA